MSYILIHNSKVMTNMPTVPFTTRLDTDLKDSLVKIAEYEDRSASYISNRAIQNLVDEREATRELIKTGLELIDKGVSISSKAVNDWVQADDDRPFPEADTFEKL